MELVKQAYLKGERALFKSHDLKVEDSIFADGESPLKESDHIDISGSIFKWKYPIWYTHHINIKDSVIDAPKTFRRGTHISLENVNMVNAQETLWKCSDINLYNVVAKGDYFGMNSENIEIDGLNLSGNYCFDGGKNIIVRNSKLVSKDAFWNCENVTVYDSVIIGEYLAWNTKNITFVNCTIESLQGLCYIEGLKMVNCKLINTTLAFEFCKDIDAQIVSHIDSITNPISGKISAQSIGEMIIDDQIIDPSQTKIQLKEM